MPRSKDLNKFWGLFWGPKFAQISLVWGSSFGPVFEHVLDHFGGHFGTHFGTRSGQEGAKMCPRGPSKTPKTQKVAFAKTLKSLQFFEVFGVQEPPKRALGGPRRLPTGTQRAPKPNKKEIQKWTTQLSIFGPILKPFSGLFWGQNWLQNGTKNGTLLEPSAPHLRGPNNAKTGNKREW